MPPDPRALLDAARAAAGAGADVAERWWRAEALEVGEKAGPDDLVSQADTETEQAIMAVLRRERPNDGLLGEETGEQTGSNGLCWVVDPIDGTTNYLYGRPDWAVSVAVMDAFRQVLAGIVIEPALGRFTEACAGGGTWSNGTRLAVLDQDDLSRAVVELNLGRPEQKRFAGGMVDALVPRVRDVRRGGSAAAALAQVATRRCDAAWLPGLQPWDCAAGLLLVAEAGGAIGDLDGQTPGAVPPSGDVLATSRQLWEPLRAVVAAAHCRPAGAVG